MTDHCRLQPRCPEGTPPVITWVMINAVHMHTILLATWHFFYNCLLHNGRGIWFPFLLLFALEINVDLRFPVPRFHVYRFNFPNFVLLVQRCCCWLLRGSSGRGGRVYEAAATSRSQQHRYTLTWQILMYDFLCCLPIPIFSSRNRPLHVNIPYLETSSVSKSKIQNTLPIPNYRKLSSLGICKA